MRVLKLPSGAKIPILGQGTWQMGETSQQRSVETDALRLGIDLGMTLIDTAEIYGEGGAEEVVADAIAGQRHASFSSAKCIQAMQRDAERFKLVNAVWDV